ncbi:MAG: hypothetical protein RLZZ453_120 [Chlamydiota bacterium]|jgi:chromosome segregation ATPase
MNPIAGLGSSMEQSLREVLRQNESIQRELNRLQSRFGRVNQQVEDCNQQVSSLRGDILRSSSYLEQRIAELENRINLMTQEIRRLAQANWVLEEEVSRLRAQTEAIANDSGCLTTIYQVFRVNLRGRASGQ